MLTIWGRRSSSNVQAVMWCVSELGLDYQRHDVGHKYGGNNTPEFLAMNPNGLIPVLRDDDGRPLWESGAILRYLAARYGDDAFWPRDPAARAQVDMWAEWGKLNVAMEVNRGLFSPIIRTAPGDRNEGAIAAALRSIARPLAIAERRFAAHPFLCGEGFTLADIPFGHILFRYFSLPLDRPDLPAVRRYYDRLTARPAYREHVMVSYDELRAS